MMENYLDTIFNKKVEGSAIKFLEHHNIPLDISKKDFLLFCDKKLYRHIRKPTTRYVASYRLTEAQMKDVFNYLKPYGVFNYIEANYIINEILSDYEISPKEFYISQLKDKPIEKYINKPTPNFIHPYFKYFGIDSDIVNTESGEKFIDGVRHIKVIRFAREGFKPFNLPSRYKYEGHKYSYGCYAFCRSVSIFALSGARTDCDNLNITYLPEDTVVLKRRPSNHLDDNDYLLSTLGEVNDEITSYKPFNLNDEYFKVDFRNDDYFRCSAVEHFEDSEIIILEDTIETITEGIPIRWPQTYQSTSKSYKEDIVLHLCQSFIDLMYKHKVINKSDYECEHSRAGNLNRIDVRGKTIITIIFDDHLDISMEIIHEEFVSKREAQFKKVFEEFHNEMLLRCVNIKYLTTVS